jgi:hypothetical protein
MKERRPSNTSDNIIKLLSGLTILALLVQGILMLHWQVTTLNAQRPNKKKLRAPDESRTTTGQRGSSSSAGGVSARVQAAFKKYKAKEKPRDLTGGGPGPEVVSKEGFIEVYREYYNKQGIRDEEYIIVMALERGDAQYSQSIVNAQKALQTNDFVGARSAVKEALDQLDERHLFARGRLLKMLSHIEFRSADPEGGRAAQREADELAIELAKIMVRGQSEKHGSDVTPEQADQMIAALSDERDLKDNIATVSMMFSGQGEDPDKAPQRIMTMLRTCIDNADKGM